ncbi:hypothetical protein ACKKBG_A00355 [Auxenochlorella protothecoides x Auxenochlorella symbiontica]
MATTARPFHLVLWGATGFTGRLVAEHLAQSYQGKVKWAIAGRSRDRLESLRLSLSTQYGFDKEDVPILLGDLEDPQSLHAAFSQAKVVISTAGPYLRLGTPVVDAAVHAGTHYVDITGEIPWVTTLVDKYHESAREKGIRLIPCCAYDSVPSDLGALLVAKHAQEKLGKKLASITTVVAEGKGGVSGGTIASGMEIASQSVKTDDGRNVYALTPRSAWGRDAEFWGVKWNEDVHKYLTGFFMQVCNNRVVHRSNYFLSYGDDFRYEETVPAKSWLGAQAIRAGVLGFGLALSQAWLHGLLLRFLPNPGQGPTREAMLGGHFKHIVLAKTQEEDGTAPTTIRAEVGWNHGDPGYWGGSRLVLEAALCLALQSDALDADPQLQRGGLLTPASGLGATLIDRLRAADFFFDIKKEA